MTVLLHFVVMVFCCVVNTITYGSYLRRVKQFDNTDTPSNMTDDQILGKSFLNCAVICHHTATCITLFVKQIPPMYRCKFSNYTLSDLRDCLNHSDGFKAYERDGTFSFASAQTKTVSEALVVTTQANFDTTLATYTTEDVMTQPHTTVHLTNTSSSHALIDSTTLAATAQTIAEVTGSEEDGVDSENETEEQGSDK